MARGNLRDERYWNSRAVWQQPEGSKVGPTTQRETLRCGAQVCPYLTGTVEGLPGANRRLTLRTPLQRLGITSR